MWYSLTVGILCVQILLSFDFAYLFKTLQVVQFCAFLFKTLLVALTHLRLMGGLIVYQ